MGTNYYWHAEPPCDKCGHEKERLHIGKSSAGWCFSLRIHPDRKINTLYDWIREWLAHADGRIRNEYGDDVSAHEMLRTIMMRSSGRLESWDAATLRKNHAKPGPNGLARHNPPSFGREGHEGEGTWDYCNYEFS